MTINILLNGANGKMGQHIVATIQANNDYMLVGTNQQSDQLITQIQSCKPDIVIDFTVASVGFHNTKTILEQGIRPVIGTSGFTQYQVQQLQALAQQKRLGGLIAPNFSISAVLMMQMAQTAAKHLNAVEIIESHHQGKKDAPSGTAIKTAEMINESRQSQATRTACETILPGSRGANIGAVPIHSIRLPGVIANQTVIFGSEGETLRIEHNTLSREAFMPGILLACKKVMQIDTLVYGLEHFL